MLDQQNLSTTGSGCETRAGSGTSRSPAQHRFDGVDLVVEWSGDLETLAHKMRSATAIGEFRLSSISRLRSAPRASRADRAETPMLWRCRFATAGDGGQEAELELPWLLSVIGEHMRWTRVDKVEAGTDAIAGRPVAAKVAP